MKKPFRATFYHTYLRIIKYIISGGLAAAVNLVTLFILVHFLRVWYLSSAIVSFSAGIGASFLLHKYFTFNNYASGTIKAQATSHIGLQLVNLCVNTLLMYIGVDLLDIPYLIAQILSGGILAISSFFIYSYFIFATHSAQNENFNTHVQQ